MVILRVKSNPSKAKRILHYEGLVEIGSKIMMMSDDLANKLLEHFPAIFQKDMVPIELNEDDATKEVLVKDGKPKNNKMLKKSTKFKSKYAAA